MRNLILSKTMSAEETIMMYKIFQSYDTNISYVEDKLNSSIAWVLYEICMDHTVDEFLKFQIFKFINLFNIITLRERGINIDILSNDCVIFFGRLDSILDSMYASSDETIQKHFANSARDYNAIILTPFISKLKHYNIKKDGQ